MSRLRFTCSSTAWCVLLVPVLTCLQAGCSTAPGVVFDPASQAVMWPAAPDTPRIRYVGQLKSARDLNAPATGLRALGQALFGKESAPEMVTPMGVCTDGADRVFVADSGAGCVHALNLKQRTHSKWSPEEATQKLLQPVAVAFDPSGRVLTADSQAAQIVAFGLDGTFIRTLGRGALRRPCGLAVQAITGNIFVADAAAHQIVVLNPEGDELRRIGERGGNAGQFNYPTNVAFDRAGQLIVSDSLNFRVQVFDESYSPVRVIGRKGDMPGYFAQPKGVAVDSDNHVYVVDANFEAVQLFDDQGRLLMSFGREGNGPGEFWLPAGMFIDRNDRVYVADAQNRRVQVFEYLAEVEP